MKKILIRTLALTLCLCLFFALASCAEEKKETNTEGYIALSQTAEAEIPAEGVWKDATYRKNRDFGEGDHTIHLEVEAEGRTVSFTIFSDKDNLAEILLEHSLVEGEESTYGLYIKKVNGITADYDVDASYWALMDNGESSMTGASGITVKDGGVYRFVYTK